MSSTRDSNIAGDSNATTPEVAANAVPAGANVAPEAAANAVPVSTDQRTSQILRGILTNNPGVTSFSVERILASIGNDRAEAALMMFAIPAIVPVVAPRGIVAVPTGVIGYQLLSGQTQIRLPRFILNKSVSRRSLEIAIHAIVPILEAAERVVRPRWRWFSHPFSRRVIGLLVFLLAIAIAYPFFGFNALHAVAIFVVSLGLAEQDGLAILLGLVAGMVSLVLVATCGVSVRAVRTKLRKTLRRAMRRLRRSFIAKFLDKIGFTRLARLLTTEWQDLLMMWDPAKREAERAQALEAKPTLLVSAPL